LNRFRKSIDTIDIIRLSPQIHNGSLKTATSRDPGSPVHVERRVPCPFERRWLDADPAADRDGGMLTVNPDHRQLASASRKRLALGGQISIFSE
jgi:hypothetical protein